MYLDAGISVLISNFISPKDLQPQGFRSTVPIAAPARVGLASDGRSSNAVCQSIPKHSD